MKSLGGLVNTAVCPMNPASVRTSEPAPVMFSVAVEPAALPTKLKQLAPGALHAAEFTSRRAVRQRTR